MVQQLILNLHSKSKNLVLKGRRNDVNANKKRVKPVITKAAALLTVSVSVGAPVTGSSTLPGLAVVALMGEVTSLSKQVAIALQI